MKTITKKPYLILWGCIPVLILISLLASNDTLDINVHDTYFVIDYYHIVILLSIPLSILALIYWSFYKTNRKLYQFLTWFHIIVTTSSFVFLLWYSIFPIDLSIDDSNTVYNTIRLIEFIMIFSILLFLLSQLLFLFNIVSSLFRNKKES